MSVRKSIDQLKHPHLKGEFACTTCPRVFLHRASLNKHRHQCSKQHTCLLCGIQIGQIDALRQHMEVSHGVSNIFTCACCAFTFLDRKVRMEHCEQLELTGTVDESKVIATAGQLPGSLLPKKTPSYPKRKGTGSLSPGSSSSSSTVNSTSPTPTVSPKDFPKPEIPVEIVEEPMDEFQSLTSEIIGKMLDNGWYSDEQLVLPETWEKMVGDAQKMAQEAFMKTDEQQKRGIKRARVE
ncbi:unnamed protein product [Caenorhabditis brenneri]